MNSDAQKELDRIIALEPNALTESDKTFLRARRSYLTDEQTKLYKDTLKEKVVVEEKKDEDLTQKDPFIPPAVELTYKELQAKATELGIKKVVGKSADQLKKLIADAEAK